ncbi:MAG: 16S rRNA (guanine(966)-N(2))-methyltransferase RsmD [Holosporaceae bacterium]|jgi:16S rRNA (guanine966-N2)-methyltransferase|nr:16S rRNA (guanine(966)-N(2))-methyltransferase RsmD [Holosporaceae bacterium]
MELRIVSGHAKGIRLEIPETVRPTRARLRQSLFDILESLESERGTFFFGRVVLDCFAGSGALGLEALSRGAAHAYFVESSREVAYTLRENIRKLGVEGSTTVICTEARFLKKRRNGDAVCDVVFLDPPYGQGSIPRTMEHLFFRGWISPDTLLVTEENAGRSSEFPQYQEIISRNYGNSLLRIGRLAAA